MQSTLHTQDDLDANEYRLVTCALRAALTLQVHPLHSTDHDLLGADNRNSAITRYTTRKEERGSRKPSSQVYQHSTSCFLDSPPNTNLGALDGSPSMRSLRSPCIPVAVDLPAFTRQSTALTHATLCA